MPSLKTLFTSAAMAYLASAKTIKITATSDNKFDPEEVKAEKGDVLEFHFEPKNHSVVAGDYRYPCSPLDMGTGFFSGFVPTDDGSANKIFKVTVNSTDPTPFYSSQGKECPDGMVGIINADSKKTLSDYKKRASELSSGVVPGKKPFGGELVDANKADSDSSSGKSSGSKGDDNAAGALGAPLAGLVVAIGLAIVMA
ncbi:extracellular serine-rich protein [Fusarium austroafricanum]|uniref:Extracellular serine-rich protein n=1 Tax=Fusarium austroafricanum TaxID=2364996 RepID=A0A8H4NPA7_9HYPO|nr:extracellular serine-rich protein [Fusarium austroafricanum]